MTSPWLLLAAASVVTVTTLDTSQLRLRVLEARLSREGRTRSRGKNLVELASYLGETRLVDAIRTANLVPALSGPGPMTLFAPSDLAFQTLSPALQHLLRTNQSALRDTLLFHVVPNRLITVSDIANNELTDSLLLGQQLRLNVYRNRSVITAAGREVEQPNQYAVNGILHEVGGVLFPPFGSLAHIAARVSVLSTLRDALSTAALLHTLEGAGPFTLFAPNDQAFQKLPAEVILKLFHNPPLLKEVLLLHVASDCLYSGAFTDGGIVETIGGQVQIRFVDGDTYVGRARVFEADVTATNGVMHVIEEVLMPSHLRPGFL